MAPNWQNFKGNEWLMNVGTYIESSIALGLLFHYHEVYDASSRLRV